MSMILEQFKRHLDKQGVLLSYYGPMKQELVENFGSLIREQLAYQQQCYNESSPKLTNSIAQHIFHIFIELAQNIARYSAQTCFIDSRFNAEFKNGLFIIGIDEEFYYIEACNLITTEQGKKLHDLLEEISGKDKEALRQLYRQKRKQAPPEGSKGAGLGFVDMARKSEHFDFQITPINDDYSLFSLQISL